jgi:hypothetical protein
MSTAGQVPVDESLRTRDLISQIIRDVHAAHAPPSVSSGRLSTSEIAREQPWRQTGNGAVLALSTPTARHHLRLGPANKAVVQAGRISDGQVLGSRDLKQAMWYDSPSS